MVSLEDLYAAAERAGLLKALLWQPEDGLAQTAWVGFRAPDETILEGLGVSTDYAITYPASALVGLVRAKWWRSMDSLTGSGRSGL